MNADRGDALLRWLCLGTLAWAALVLQAGGFTTSIHAGMAFLDWPLSNGSVNPPGWLTEIDKFAEHSHRLAAAGLGLLCVAIAWAHAAREQRRTPRLAAYALLGLVAAQGMLGGLRVLLDQLNIGGEGNAKALTFAVMHGVNAQLTIALLSGLAVGHLGVWRVARSCTPALRSAGRVAFVAILAVIIAGALMRQSRSTLWVAEPTVTGLFVPSAGEGAAWWLNLLHRSGAVLAGLLVLRFAYGLAREGRRGLAASIAVLLGLQTALGALGLTLPLNPHVRTVHVVTAAALLSLLTVGVLLAHRHEGPLREA
ncbi:MAG: COX15/CtaA family protein [Opitutales bacterium]